MLGPRLSVLDDLPAPGARAASLVAGWWARTSIAAGSAVVVPDGAVDLMAIGAGAPFLAGPDTVPHPVETVAGTLVVGVRLRPGVARALIRDDVEQIRDQRIRLDEARPGAVVDRLHHQLAVARTSAGGEGPEPVGAEPAPGSHRAVLSLVAALTALVEPAWVPDPAVVEGLGRIERGLTPDPGGLGPRQFRRRFVREVGYGPTFYRRVVRLGRFTDLLDGHPNRSMAELAAGAGYSDESHLWRDCVALTGSTPGALRPAG